MFDENMKPWVLEVNSMPSLSSSSVFDKQVKTMLIADTFSLIGIRGYDKNVVRQQQEKDLDQGIKKTPKQSDPPFKQTMTTEEVEKLGGCLIYEEADPQKVKAKVLKNLNKTHLDENYEKVNDNRSNVGTGPGFTGDELLSKDELNLIMDLEDEQRRLG